MKVTVTAGLDRGFTLPATSQCFTPYFSPHFYRLNSSMQGLNSLFNTAPH